MNFRYYIFYILLIIFQGCQNQNSKPYHNDDFNWIINFPVEYERLSYDDWSKKVEQSVEITENSYNVDFKNQSTPIFNFKNNSDYFESTKNKYEGSREDYFNYLNEFLQIQIQTVKDQMPEVEIDSKLDTISINGLIFYHNYMTIVYPNGAKRVLESFNRLFENNNELSINIIYVNKEFGDKFKTALLNSKFKK